jgi:cytochrome c553
MAGMQSRWFSRLRRILLVLVLGLLVLVIAAYAVSEAQLRHSFPIPKETIRAALDSGQVARGRHLASAVGGCTGCHGQDLGGRLFIDMKPMGRWYAPNLTMGNGGAASRMSDAQLEAIIRHGVRDDGRSVQIMPSESYSGFADEDIAALLGYMRSIPPVDRESPAPTVGPVARVLVALGRLPIQTAPRVPRLEAHASWTPSRTPSPEYGRYLAEVAGCVSCHGPGLSGGMGELSPPGGKPAANLTPAGIGHYGEADLARALRTGMRPGGEMLDSLQMPWTTFRDMTDEEIQALWAYLRSVPPKPFGSH